MEPRWWLRLAVPSNSERSQEHPLQRPRIHRRNGQGEGTTRPTAGAAGAAHQREHPRPGRRDLVRHRRQLPIRTAGPGAAIHRGQLRPQADVPRRDRGQPTPGDDAVTVAITVEHNEARLADTLAFLDAGTNPARLRIYGGTRPATPATTPASAMLVEIRLTKPAGTIAGGLLTLTQQEDGLITSTGVATWARLVNGNEVTALDLDCSGTDGDGDVKLASTNLYLGGDARMVSAILG